MVKRNFAKLNLLGQKIELRKFSSEPSLTLSFLLNEESYTNLFFSVNTHNQEGDWSDF